METPLLYRQLQDQLRQWVRPVDQRHLQVFSEILAAILQSGSGVMGKWIPYLAHRTCQARAHLERFSYFLHNQQITAERFYQPILRPIVSAFAGEAVLLTLDTSMMWDQFCLIEVCLVWGGRSFTLAQTVLDHGSATVGFEQYQPVLECAKHLLPQHCQVTLLADRGFEHSQLIHWLNQQGWSWAIRVKSNLQVTLTRGCTQSVEHLIPPQQHAYLFENVQVLDGASRATLRPHRYRAAKTFGRCYRTNPHPSKPLPSMASVLVALSRILRITSRQPSTYCNRGCELPSP